MSEQPDPRIETLKHGDRRSQLQALLEVLVDAMADADPNVRPQHAARIQAVMAEMATLPSLELTEVDELVERRKARRAAADAGVRSKQQRGA